MDFLTFVCCRANHYFGGETASMIIGIFHAVTVALDILMRFGKKKGFIRTLVRFLTVRKDATTQK